MFHSTIESVNALATPWFSWMAASILHATVLLAIVSLLWFAIRRKAPAQLGYLLFLLVPLKLFVVLQVPIPASITAWLPFQEAVPGASTLPTAVYRDAPLVAIAVRETPVDIDLQVANPANQRAASLSFITWLMLAWIFVVTILFARLLRAEFQFRRRLRAAKDIDPGSLPVDFHALKNRIGVRRTIRIIEIDLVNSPAAAGIVRPTLILPVSFAASLPPAQLEWVLLHELAHVRRRDVAVKCFQRVAGIVYFFNPAIWIANRAIDRLREYACDDIATSLTGDARLTASEAFLTIVRHASKPTASLAGALGVVDSAAATSAARRLSRLLDADRRIRIRVGFLPRVAFILIALIALPRLYATDEPPAAAQKPQAANAKPEATESVKQPEYVDFTVIIAKHVMLLDGKEFITWDELEKKIAALPNPSLAYPHYYYTNGSYESGANTTGQKKSMEIYRQHKLSRSTIGGLLPRRGFFFDQIRTADDLKVDESLRVEGRVIDQDRNGVAGAEVILITPVDETIPYKTFDIYMVEGRLRNPLDEVVTRTGSDGNFAIYPPRDTKYRVIALHPEKGIAFGYEEQLKKGEPMRFLEWGTLMAEFAEDTIPELAEKKVELSASLRTHLRGEGGMPEINFTQDTSNSKATVASARRIVFSHVPPIFDSAISRNFPGEQGVSFSVPYASVALIAGETRSIALGPITPQQWQRIEDSRRSSEERRAKVEAAATAKP